jgi:hypothetical protein
MKQLTYLLVLFCLPFFVNAQYTGTASVTQGIATKTDNNLYPCVNGRVTDVGSIVANNSSIWIVPAIVNFKNNGVPFASNLYNPCTGVLYPNDLAALAGLNGSDIVNIDSSGEVITAFIFADNYFEMYINGVAVGKDNVPFTQFNSSIVRFRVNRPFTIAMLLVDWEEHLGIGCEISNGFQYHMGDGGMVGVFKDSLNNIIAKTGGDWKAQTFYTAPIIDLTCPTEIGSNRITANCSTQDSNNGTSYYGLHWNRPANWMDASFNDSIFPKATTYSNAIVGINNKPAYTNFTNIFDDPANDAQFIWSTNIILDNEVIVRHTVSVTTGISEMNNINKAIHLYPNPAKNDLRILLDKSIDKNDVKNISIYNLLGENVLDQNEFKENISLNGISNGIYFVKVMIDNYQLIKKLIIQ